MGPAAITQLARCALGTFKVVTVLPGTVQVLNRIVTAGGRPARARVTTFRRMGDSMNSFYFLGRVVPRAV